jgi:Tfp pilus assembly protein PilO
MKVEMTPTNRAIVAVLAIVALAVAFWLLLLGPKRDEAKKLGTQISNVESSLSRHRAEVAEALEAREEFSSNYRQLVVLGKAVPGDDDSASLLVQLNRIGERSDTTFKTIKLYERGGEAPPAPVAAAGATTAATPISPTEAAAATLPLGASIGPAGLAVMPYSLTYNGNFSRLADFIEGLDSLVETKSGRVAVDGRLVTVDGFALTGRPSEPFPALQGTFSVTTYVTPPSQGVTGGATPSAPAPATATPASTSIGGTP